MLFINFNFILRCQKLKRKINRYKTQSQLNPTITNWLMFGLWLRHSNRHCQADHHDDRHGQENAVEQQRTPTDLFSYRQTLSLVQSQSRWYRRFNQRARFHDSPGLNAVTAPLICGQLCPPIALKNGSLDDRWRHKADLVITGESRSGEVWRLFFKTAQKER